MKKKKIIFILVISILSLYFLSYVGAMMICNKQGWNLFHHFPYPKCYGGI